MRFVPENLAVNDSPSRTVVGSKVSAETDTGVYANTPPPPVPAYTVLVNGSMARVVTQSDVSPEFIALQLAPASVLRKTPLPGKFVPYIILLF